MDTTKWNYNEFSAFLLIYAAHADIDYSVEEQAHIKAKIGEEEYDKVYKAFTEMTDIQVLQTIDSYKGTYFPTSDRKAELMHRVEELFEADGDYSSMEKTLKMFLDHLL